MRKESGADLSLAAASGKALAIIERMPPNQGSELRLEEGRVEIMELADGRRRVTLRPARQGSYVERESCETTFPRETIEAFARFNFPLLCDALARHDEPEYIQDILERQLLGYFRKEEFAGKRLLDFGCGTGASTLFMARLLPDTEFVGVELSAENVALAERALAARGCANVRFLRSPDGNRLPEGIGRFEYVMLSAVFEHLLPEERQRVMPLVWSHLQPGGALFLNQTPHSYFPYDHHSSGLWGVNYLPDALALAYVRRWSKMNPEINRSPDWRKHLRGGLRGGSEREVLKCLNSAGEGRAVLLQPREGDRASYWMSGLNQRRHMWAKRAAALFFRCTDRLWGTVPSMNLDMVVRKEVKARQ